MKRLFPLVLFWFSMTALSAQTVMERVIEIRRAYAEAQDRNTSCLRRGSNDDAQCY